MNVSSLGISDSLSCAEALGLFSPRVSYPWTAHSIQQIPTTKGITWIPHKHWKDLLSPRVTRLEHSSPPPGPQAAPASDTTIHFLSFRQQLLPLLLWSIKGWWLATPFQALGMPSYSLHPDEQALAISYSMSFLIQHPSVLTSFH